MLVLSDEVELKKMLGGVTALPEAVLNAYKVRRAFRNMSGAGAGPMGVDALVQILIDCGETPRQPKEYNQVQNTWKDAKPGDRVEIHLNGEWVPGSFHRIGSLGQIEVRRENSARVFCAKSFDVRPFIEAEVPVTAENAEVVTVFADGSWQEGTIRKRRTNGTLEVCLPNDTKAFRIFNESDVRYPELASE